MSEQAKKAVEAIVSDLTGRRGLRQEWENIDPEIVADIKEVWADLIDRAFAPKGTPA